ncbi:uncharacterized protein LOC113949010 isoform X5 [Corapipo altera]|nr:uncharacterized protein LOC113949010 isoform X4 [Corapipo altera]XP_027502911.1 uncharacterized protein LOC113949010 isoform X5 [Corapipo altera]
MVLPVIIPLGSGLTPAGIGFNPSRSPPAAPPTAAARSLENRGNQALFRPGPRCAATLRLQPRGWHGGTAARPEPVASHRFRSPKMEEALGFMPLPCPDLRDPAVRTSLTWDSAL